MNLLKSVRACMDTFADYYYFLFCCRKAQHFRPNICAITGGRNSFKNALQENILVNGLPLMIDESETLSLSAKEDNMQMVDDVLFGKLSKKVGNVARERKFFPEQCCRILNIEMKHELQNLKKAKVVDSSLPSTSLQSSIKSSDRTHLKNFSDFCQGFRTMQETVQCKIQEEEKMAMKLSLIEEIHKKQKLS